MRFDLYLVANNYFESRNKAANAVKSGYFTVNGKKVLKPALEIFDGDIVKKIVNEKIYVARSAHKLLKAYQIFTLDWKKKVVADLGASTGGFCQVLLEKDVEKVYAVDIGTAQLHPTIRNDERVINMEHTNARYLTAESFPEVIHCITADLSFISIKTVLPAIYQVLPQGGEAVVLIKPQFEAGPKHLTKNGVLTDLKIQSRVIDDVAHFSLNLGFGIAGISFSGLAGESGNREYLLYLIKNAATSIKVPDKIHSAVYTEE